MAEPTNRDLTEADLYAPDLDEGVLDVEHYPVPEDAPEALQEAWREAIRLLGEGEEVDEDGGESA